MFGSPLLTTFIISILFLSGGLVGFSILNITPNFQPAPEAEVESESEEVQPVFLTIRSAHQLKSVIGFIGDTEIQFEQITPYEAEAEIVSPKMLEFTLQLEWTSGTPETAVLIQATPEAKPAAERTIWAQGSLTEELTFFLQ